MKIIDTIFNGRPMPARKKKVLVTGAVAFVILLFVSFLLSLTEGDKNTAEQQEQAQQSAVGQQIPSSQRYDFAQENTEGEGLENLLNAPSDSAQQEIGVNKDPFASMDHGRPQPAQPAPNAQVPSEPLPNNNQQASIPSYGPAPIPQKEEAYQAPAEPVQGYSLYCDHFPSAAEAESQKAILAFQGLSATVVSANDGTFRLKLGPYADKETARSTFGFLGERGLVQQCSLK